MALEGAISDRHRLVVEEILGHIKWLQRHIVLIDGQIMVSMRPYREEWKLLQTIPGLDVLIAEMLIAEMWEDMSRFGSKERLCSWAAMCPDNQESAVKEKVVVPEKVLFMFDRLCVKRPLAQGKPKGSFKGYTRGL